MLRRRWLAPGVKPPQIVSYGERKVLADATVHAIFHAIGPFGEEKRIDGVDDQVNGGE